MNFNKGSIETMVVTVKDELKNLVALPDPTYYDILETNDTPVAVDQIATVDGLQATCLIDTTAMDEGDYDLYLKFTVGVETPLLGPHRFRVK